MQSKTALPPEFQEAQQAHDALHRVQVYLQHSYPTYRFGNQVIDQVKLESGQFAALNLPDLSTLTTRAKALSKRVDVLEQAIRAEFDPQWDCSSYHPKLAVIGHEMIRHGRTSLVDRAPGYNLLEPQERSAEQLAEAFIQNAVDAAPEPLRRLGDWLSRKLDEDDWKTAEPLLLGAAVAHRRDAPAPQDSAEAVDEAPQTGRMFAAGLFGLLSEASGKGLFDRHGDDDLTERVQAALADYEEHLAQLRKAA